ncbi:small gtp binding protein rab8 [Anaeramoeba flamelloides]|uniref:Small gtp binding protein rab8 n=1 Tax=Anaeramoeba flamelloides TaxID=1746091 RepID=A0AAV7ZFI4_9EUKA|nr:small gtp binding protein rab8 [Anaeramoeba flamelloides]
MNKKSKKNKAKLIKILIIGDSMVGKSNIFSRYMLDTFRFGSTATIGVEYENKFIEIDGKKYNVQLWDSAGQEKFRSIGETCYRGALGIVLVYNICNRTTFENIRNWLVTIEEHAKENTCLMLLANKIDLEEDRRVTKKMGQEIANEYGMPFYETSALKNINLEQAFTKLVRNIQRDILDLEKDNDIISLKEKKLPKTGQIIKEERKETQGGCC